MKLWDNKDNLNQEIEKFTVGKDRELDLLLAKYDVLGSIAHVKMLQSVNLIAEEEFSALQSELKHIYEDIQNGKFCLDEDIEDIHSQIEIMLTHKLGEVGQKIHAGRSRNDQVLVDIRMYIREEIKNIVSEVHKLFDLLLKLSDKYKQAFLPGYTHMQIAMPSSFGLWFGAYAESLVDDLILLKAAYQIVNKNPLGSAAGYGSSLPLNRQLTTEFLGFDKLNVNVVYAQMGRGKTEKIVSYAISLIAATLGKLSTDICLYMNQNFGFVSFPEELTTGSSIMPHKKNPDVFELIRAKCNKLQALPTEINLVSSNLPSGYHRDFQILKENFLPSFTELRNCIKMAQLMLSKIKINEIHKDLDIYQKLFSVEAVNQLVQQGVPFRTAYRKIAKEIEEGNFTPPADIHYSHEGSIGNLQNRQINEEMKKVVNTFNFEQVENALKELVEGIN